MRCSNCKHLVDPVTLTNDWFLHIIEPRAVGGVPTPLQVLAAIHQWDRSCMDAGGQSVLPTELRDTILNTIIREGSKPI